jgi:hypothetical protein
MENNNVGSDVKEVVVEKKDYSDIFVTENDTFDVTIKYYKKDGKVYVENVDENFDNNEIVSSFIITFKYPDQGDSSKIINFSYKANVDLEKIDYKDLFNLEFSRLVCLIRKWNVGKELNNKLILSMNPKIIKAITISLREKIGMDGII